MGGRSLTPSGEAQPLFIVRRRRSTRLLVKILWAVGVIGLLALYGWVLSRGQRLGASDFGLMLAPTILVLGPLIAFTFILRPAYEELRLYPEKLVTQRKGVVREAKWTAFKHVSFGIFATDGRPQQRLHIQFKRLSVRPAPDLCSQELLAQIEQITVRKLLKQALADYRNSREISLGPLTISKQGLGTKDATLAWKQVASIDLQYEDVEEEGVRLQKPLLKVKGVGRYENFASVDIREMPNMRVFIGLLENALSEVIQLNLAYEKYVQQGEM